MNTNETKPRSGGVPGEAAYAGPAVAYGANGSSATVNSTQYGVPVEAQFKKTVAVKNEFQGYRPAYTPSLVAAGPAPMPMPMPVPYDERTGLVWGIAILGMFVFIFSVTVLILLFTISLENNQIASSILSGLSALFILVMIGLLFRYDRLSGNTADAIVADQQPVGVMATTMPAEAAPMVVSAPPPPPPPAAPAPPTDASADVAPAPEVGGYYYGYGQGANQYNNYPRYPGSAYYR